MSWWQSFVQLISEPEHVLAMLTLGAWAAQLGAPAALVLPITFPFAVLFGVSLGAVPLPWAEAALGGTVVALGLLLAFAVQPALPVAVTVAWLIAGLHSYENGLEMPFTFDPASYHFGLVVAAVSLHLLGLGLGWAALPIGPWVGRLGGTAVALAGMALIVRAIG